MAAQVKITENELIAAIREAAKAEADASGYASCQEIREALGSSLNTTRQHLQRLHRMGRLLVGFRMQADISGRVNKIPTYKVMKGR